MVSKAVLELSRDILRLVRETAASEVMVNAKTGTNTIAPGSDIFRAIQVAARNDGDLVFDIILNSYIRYIESGRKAGGRFPPVEPIVRWARKHGIPTDNSTIFLIRRAIARDGIRPRPLMDRVFASIDKAWDDEYAGEIFNSITEVIDDFFK